MWIGFLLKKNSAPWSQLGITPIKQPVQYKTGDFTATKSEQNFCSTDAEESE
jgi:hypothetical protein